MPPSISLEEGNGYVNRMRRIIKSYPEVDDRRLAARPARRRHRRHRLLQRRILRAAEAVRHLARGRRQGQADRADERGAARRSFPGVDFNFSQYIEDNVEEAASGVKGENSVKLFGNDLATLEKTAAKIKEVMSTVPGITDLAVFNSLGQPTVRIDVDRARAARYGLAPGDINATIAAAIGGQAAGNLYEDGSDRNFPIIVRLAPEYRAEPRCDPPHHRSARRTRAAAASCRSR